MNLNFQFILDAFAMMSGWEFIAVIFGIIYVIGATKESAWCWIAGFFSTLIYTIIFWKGQLLSSSLLNFYYMGMAIYGYILWKRGEEKETTLQITSWSIHTHLLAILIALFFSLVVGYTLSSYTDARLPYLDASITVFSVLATWMLAQKIRENWLYWILTDSAAIILYWSTGYYVTILLFMLYVVLSFYGYRSWKKEETR